MKPDKWRVKPSVWWEAWLHQASPACDVASQPCLPTITSHALPVIDVSDAHPHLTPHAVASSSKKPHQDVGFSHM
ncbi:hypothetical protein E2C01_013929 [Portunus trituberculatus]|uniref:Uncharacterized protein n=1 Tax=Portunus trituberculatus TaxID=210409 RepID=A0A5B7DIN4_PORTR|nr:hypothetical protein [Portunus trituberculatus]